MAWQTATMEACSACVGARRSEAAARVTVQRVPAQRPNLAPRRNDLTQGVRATAALVAGTQGNVAAGAELMGAAVTSLLLPAVRERLPAARSAHLCPPLPSNCVAYV